LKGNGNMSLLKLRKFAQVTLPADLRKKFNLAEGDFLEAEAVEKGIPSQTSNCGGAREGMESSFSIYGKCQGSQTETKAER